MHNAELQNKPLFAIYLDSAESLQSESKSANRLSPKACPRLGAIQPRQNVRWAVCGKGCNFTDDLYGIFLRTGRPDMTNVHGGAGANYSYKAASIKNCNATLPILVPKILLVY